MIIALWFWRLQDYAIFDSKTSYPLIWHKWRTCTTCTAYHIYIYIYMYIVVLRLPFRSYSISSRGFTWHILFRVNSLTLGWSQYVAGAGDVILQAIGVPFKLILATSTMNAISSPVAPSQLLTNNVHIKTLMNTHVLLHSCVVLLCMSYCHAFCNLQ